MHKELSPIDIQLLVAIAYARIQWVRDEIDSDFCIDLDNDIDYELFSTLASKPYTILFTLMKPEGPLSSGRCSPIFIHFSCQDSGGKAN